MLAVFRNIAGGFFAKLLLGLLVLSFAVWGIGDIFRGGGDQVIASIEGETVTTGELDALIDLLQRNYEQITPEAIGDPFFKLEVLNTIINDKLLQLEARKYGLRFTEDILARITARNPMFQKPDGSFDADLFTMTLRQNGHTEHSYLAKLREEMTRSLFHDLLQLGIAPSDEMVAMYQKIRDEEREARLVLMTDKDIEAPKTPDDTALQIFYESRAQEYMNPEFRTLNYVSFDADSIWKALKLSPTEDVLKTMYEERKEAYVLPEKRTVSQLLFADAEQAQEAYEALSNGKRFSVIAKQDNVLNKDTIKLGTVTQDELLDEAAEPVFSLEKDAFSAPIESSFGWHIYTVSHIKPAYQQSFAEVKKSLQADYRAETIETEITQLGYRIEDALASGMDLAQALEANGLSAIKLNGLGPVSFEGIKPNGKRQEVSPLQQDVLNTGFGLDANESSNLQVSESNDYYIVQVVAITESQLKPLSEVRKDILAAYKAQEINVKLRDLASETADSLRDAENKSAAIRDAGLRTINSGRIKRHHETVNNSSKLRDKILTSGFTLELFTLQPGESTNAYPLPSGEYVIGILDKIHPAKRANEKRINRIREELTSALPDEMMIMFLTYLRDKYEVEIMQEKLFETIE
ncbi:MAG: SurA N-terminal domain-containing protein [Rickettsiales bacterium]|nr:SurA N-terminal domain-containing protein [Rickettsiales bacterium]